MKKFLDDDFMINNKTGKRLFLEYAKDMPIYDYHCHLSPKEIYENKRFKNLTEAWLYGDHYKWRLLRANGFEEKYVTGDADDYDKYMAWAKTVPLMIGNPLYHWTHLELKRFFGIDLILNPENADVIWEKANRTLQSEEFTARGLIKRSNVKVICTTDDPVDDLEYHRKIKEEGKLKTKVLPTFRPETSINIERDTFMPWFKKLQDTRMRKIEMFYEFLEAIEMRMDYFHERGCRIADCSLAYIPCEQATFSKAKAVYEKVMSGQKVSMQEADIYKTFMLEFYGKLYAERGWVMQLHLGVIRNNNTRMFNKVGRDTGFDSISDYEIANSLAKLLDSMDESDSLPKTILYNLNPKDNYVLATMAGNFQDRVAGKIQYGSGWWYNDTRDGIEYQMETLANVGLLSNFIGMLTDSRSFLSYTRHEYFRRIMCNLIGGWVEKGEYPADFNMLGKIVKDISYNNAKNYFNIEVD